MLYIDSNLSPSEVVSKYPELQVCPEIAEWAQAAEDIESIVETANDCQNEARCALYPEDYLYNIRYLVNSLVVKTDNAKQIPCPELRALHGISYATLIHITRQPRFLPKRSNTGYR